MVSVSVVAEATWREAGGDLTALLPGKSGGGRPCKMTAAKIRRPQAAMGQPDAKVGEPCAEPGVTRQTLYRHVGPNGQLRPDGEKPLG